MLEVKSDEWIDRVIEDNDLPDVDYYDWNHDQKAELIDAYFMSLESDDRHDIMCEVDALIQRHNLSPISRSMVRGKVQASVLLDYLSDFIDEMMLGYDCKQRERD